IVVSAPRGRRRAGWRRGIVRRLALLRAADGDRVDLERGLAHAHRYALAVLAAHADALVQGHIIADHGDALEHFGAVADQRRALDRRADATVFDAIGLVGREHEVARGDIHRAAGEIHCIDAVVDRGDDGARVAVA